MTLVEPQLGELAAMIAGEAVRTGDVVEIRSPYDGAPVALVHRAGAADVERAIAAAVEAFEVTRRLPSWRKAEVLLAIAAGIGARREELGFSYIVVHEAEMDALAPVIAELAGT